MTPWDYSQALVPGTHLSQLADKLQSTAHMETLDDVRKHIVRLESELAVLRHKELVLFEEEQRKTTQPLQAATNLAANLPIDVLSLIFSFISDRR